MTGVAPLGTVSDVRVYQLQFSKEPHRPLGFCKLLAGVARMELFLIIKEGTQEIWEWEKNIHEIRFNIDLTL